MARHRVLIAVAVVFDGDYYEPHELVPETWRWIEGTLTDRDDLKSAEMLSSLVLDDPEAKVTLKFDGGGAPDAVKHWAPESGTS